MEQFIEEIQVATPGPGLVDVTRQIQSWVATRARDTGLLTLMVQHTSASLTIQENADPDVLADLGTAMAGLAPHGGRERYRHASEGPDDMAAHIRTVLSGVTLSVPVRNGKMMLGTWQGIYLWEHRDRGRIRTLGMHLLSS